MFYSHEILTSQTHGVATVWLVSTIGLRSTTKKISRKAIQEVNVKKACETILQPAAPIALRLQGSLLYGLSRVYSRQCHYVLTDAEKVQAHMRAFYNALGGSGNALDPQAGKSKRNELILEDDPEFDLFTDLPAFHFDDDGNLVVPHGSQSSRRTSSQLSPFQGEGSISSSNRSFLAAFDLSNSPFGGGNSILGDPFGAGTASPGKGADDMMPFGEEERELQALDDWGIEIDADGNIIPVLEEPQLPQLPHPEEDDSPHLIPQDDFMPVDDQGDVIMGGAGDVFRSDPPIPLQQERGQKRVESQGIAQSPDEQEAAFQDEASSGQAQVRARRQRRRPILAPDNQTKIPRHELKSWSANYLVNAEQASQPRHGVTATEARKNAFNLIFGRGISSIGFPTGVPCFPHPLASQFAGEGLQARLLGIIVTRPESEDFGAARGRRRSALEALEVEEDEAGRRVRRRLSEEDDQHAQLQHPEFDDGLLPLLGDEELPPVEVGRRAESVLPDVPSDVPWNRGSSQIPSSSIKGGGGSKPPSRHVSASPLHGRGNLSVIPVGEVERFSDNAPFLGSDGGAEGFAPLHSGPRAEDSSLLVSSPPPLSGTATKRSTSAVMHQVLDREGKNFLDYIAAIAKEQGGEVNNDDDSDIHASGSGSNRRWLDFDELFESEDRTRAVVAQAFFHVLSLATKSVIRVKQEGQGGIDPFGPIRLGVEVSFTGDDGDKDDDEEMLGE